MPGQKPQFGGGFNQNMKPGDWICPAPDCGKHNFAKNQCCIVCGEDHPAYLHHYVGDAFIAWAKLSTGKAETKSARATSPRPVGVRFKPTSASNASGWSARPVPPPRALTSSR